MSARVPDEHAIAYRRHHVEMLIIAVLVILASLLLRIENDGEVQVGTGISFHMPPLCASRSLFGVDCPGCGLTRCFVRLGHGRWSDALAMNRVGWLLALAVVLQLPYRILAIVRHEAFPIGRRIPKLFGWFLIVCLVGSWGFKQVGI